MSTQTKNNSNHALYEAPGSLVIRADASSEIGTGHVMRCLALGEAWQAQGGIVKFLSYCENDGLHFRIRERGFGLVPLERPHPNPDDLARISETVSGMGGGGPSSRPWVVLDGYHFDPSYQRNIKESGHPLLVIDDMAHQAFYDADILLNQNVHAETFSYPCRNRTELLLGTRFALLRKEFLPLRGHGRETSRVAGKVLVTMGGGDSRDAIPKVIRALSRTDVEGLQVKVVAGPSNPRLKEIQRALSDASFSSELLPHADNMPKLMAWADIAVAAAGSTSLEMAFMGLPSLVMILAENQRGVAEGLEERGIASNLGWHHRISSEDIADVLGAFLRDPNKRTSMGVKGRTLVDGRGADRVVACIREYTAKGSMGQKC